MIHHELGNILRDTGRLDDDVRAYQETLKIDPQFWASYWEMAGALRVQGKFTQSIQARKQGADGVVRKYKINPGVISAINELEPAYRRSGRLGYFRQALKVDAYYPRPDYYLSRDHAQLGI